MGKLVIYEGNINDTKFIKLDRLDRFEELQKLILTLDWVKIVEMLQKMHKNNEIGRFAVDSYKEVRIQAVGSTIFYKFIVE